jgi:hypothetical protein
LDVSWKKTQNYEASWTTLTDGKGPSFRLQP